MFALLPYNERVSVVASPSIEDIAIWKGSCFAICDSTQEKER